MWVKEDPGVIYYAFAQTACKFMPVLCKCWWGLHWDLKCHISQRHLCCVWRWIGYTGIGLCCVSQEFRTLAPRQILKTKGKRITWLSSLRTMVWRRVPQKHVSRAGTSKDIPLYLWDLITFPTLDVVESWVLIFWYLSLCAGDQWT